MTKHTTHACHICHILTYLRLNLQNTNDTTVMAKWRRVAFIDELFDIIEEVHCRQKGHIGSKKTILEVKCTVSVYVCYVIFKLVSTLKISKLYECIPRSAVDKFVQLCLLCHARKPQSNRAPLRPFISSGYMTSGQVR